MYLSLRVLLYSGVAVSMTGSKTGLAVKDPALYAQQILDYKYENG